MDIINPLDRLKVLINSSTPIVVMETVEELRAVALVRQACSDLNMATFEWTIADGLVRSGSKASAASALPNFAKSVTIPPGNSEDSRLARAVLSSFNNATSRTRPPVTTPRLRRLPSTTPPIPCRRSPIWNR